MVLLLMVIACHLNRMASQRTCMLGRRWSHCAMLLGRRRKATARRCLPLTCRHGPIGLVRVHRSRSYIKRTVTRMLAMMSQFMYQYCVYVSTRTMHVHSPLAAQFMYPIPKTLLMHWRTKGQAIRRLIYQTRPQWALYYPLLLPADPPHPSTRLTVKPLK